jgi:hypothetical protein
VPARPRLGEVTVSLFADLDPRRAGLLHQEQVELGAIPVGVGIGVVLAGRDKQLGEPRGGLPAVVG